MHIERSGALCYTLECKTFRFGCRQPTVQHRHHHPGAGS
jgi:hypothetical protein